MIMIHLLDFKNLNFGSFSSLQASQTQGLRCRGIGSTSQWGPCTSVNSFDLTIQYVLFIYTFHLSFNRSLVFYFEWIVSQTLIPVIADASRVSRCRASECSLLHELSCCSSSITNFSSIINSSWWSFSRFCFKILSKYVCL